MRILAISIVLANIVATGISRTIEEALDTPWSLTESTESCLTLTQVFLEKYQRCSETIHKQISELEFRITVDYNEELVDRKNEFLEIYLEYELYTYGVIKELSEECSNELHGDLKRKLSIAGQALWSKGKSCQQACARHITPPTSANATSRPGCMQAESSWIPALHQPRRPLSQGTEEQDNNGAPVAHGTEHGYKPFDNV